MNGLTPSDLASLAASFITPELADKAGVRRVDDLEGSEIVGRTRKAGAEYAGLVFPYILPNGPKVREYRLRRDHPDYEQKPDGSLKEIAKYLCPPGRGNMLYFPPGTTTEMLADTKLPVVITEGEKKTLAVHRLATHVGPPEFLAIGLSGVWNWRGTGKGYGKQGERVSFKKPIDDLSLLSWTGREVTILFDSDAAENSLVTGAIKGLSKELDSRGATVRVAELPTSDKGIDDFLGRVESEKGLESAIDAGLALLNEASEGAEPTFVTFCQPLDHVLRPVEQLELSDLPQVLSDWIVPASRVIGCPVSYMALSAVTIAGGLLGSRIRLKPMQHSDWMVVPNLYAGAVGYPSQKKSPALDETRKPLIRLQTEANAKFETEKKDYEIGKLFFDKEKANLLKKATSKEDLVASIASLSEPLEPIRKRYEVNDATSIKLLTILSQNPNGVILSVDELTSWLASLDNDYDAESRSRYLHLWKGAVSTSFDRADGREITIRSGTVSIIGSIQPAKLQRYIAESYSDNNADGLPQRLLYDYPDRTPQRRPNQADYDAAVEGCYDAGKVFSALAKRDFRGNCKADNGDSFRSIKLNPEAQALADAWIGEIEAEATQIEKSDQPFSAYLLKAPKNCFAFALIFHVLEHVASTNEIPDEVDADTMARAIGYIDYLLSHARRVFSLGENRIFGLAESLLGKIRDGSLEQGFTTYTIKRKQWAGLTKVDVIQDVLDLLVDYGWLATLQSTAGRPTVKYYVRPETVADNGGGEDEEG